MNTKLFRYYQYFRRAHNTYFAFIIQLINFTTITYTLLFVQLLNFPNVYTYFMIYLVVFTVLYVPFCIFIGWLDYKKGLAPIESSLTWRTNPVTQDLLKALYYIANGEKEKAIEILRKYIDKNM